MIAWTFRTVVAVAVAVAAAQMIGLFDGSLAKRLADGPPAAAAAPAPAPVVLEAGGSREVHIAAHDSGHYLIEAAVNGADMPFMVDTGASWVTLTMSDAQRAGIETEWLDFDVRIQTANGIVRAAKIDLEEVRIGELELRDVRAMVNDAPMGISLLGMSFLERLDGYEVREETLILRW
jgi:aspartyl protease family protein